MSDIVFVCVSADLEQAEALAGMFEDAGLTVGDYGEDATATIVLWSNVAARSGPFREAAENARRTGDAVAVSLTPPGALEIKSAEVFDLSNWDGDPNSPLIDPMFFAVDRRIVAAHATALEREARATKRNPKTNVVVISADEEDAPCEDFDPPRITAAFNSWLRPHGLSGRMRALAFVVFLGGGAAAAGLTLGGGAHQADTRPVAANVAPETVADAMLPPVSLSELTENVEVEYAEEPAPVRRGLEPPSASSIGRRTTRERTPAPYRSWEHNQAGARPAAAPPNLALIPTSFLTQAAEERPKASAP